MKASKGEPPDEDACENKGCGGRKRNATVAFRVEHDGVPFVVNQDCALCEVCHAYWMNDEQGAEMQAKVTD